MLSAEGRCKTLDAAADGYVRAEAVCVIALADLSHAAVAGTQLHVVALLAGSAVNQVRACAAALCALFVYGASQVRVFSAALEVFFAHSHADVLPCF